MAAEIDAGKPLTVTYTDPSGDNSAGVVQDPAGNDAATFTKTLLNRPGPPRNAMKEKSALSSLAFSWDAPDFDGAAGADDDITDYVAQWRNPAVDPVWQDASLLYLRDLTGAINPGSVMSNNTYEVRVRAVNRAGGGPHSNVVAYFIPRAPGSPKNLQLVFEETSGGYDAKFSWDDPDHLGGGTLDRYTWQLSVPAKSFAETASVDSAPAADSPITQSLDSPVPGDVYRFKVTVWNEFRPSTVDIHVVFLLGDGGAPDLRRAWKRHGGLKLEWDMAHESCRFFDLGL